MTGNELLDRSIGSILEEHASYAVPESATVWPLVAQRMAERQSGAVVRGSARRRTSRLQRAAVGMAASALVATGGLSIAAAASVDVRTALQQIGQATGILSSMSFTSSGRVGNIEPAPSFHLFYPGYVPGALQETRAGQILPAQPARDGRPSIPASASSGGWYPCPSTPPACAGIQDPLARFTYPPELQSNSQHGIEAVWFLYQALPPGTGYVQIDEQANRADNPPPPGQTITLAGTHVTVQNMGNRTALTFIRLGTRVDVIGTVGLSEAERVAQSLMVG